MDNTDQPLEPKTKSLKGMILSIIILCVVIVLLVWWMKDKRIVVQNEIKTNPVIEVPSAITEPSPAELQENFVTSVAVLVEDISKMGSKSSSELISTVEDRLVAIRVPSHAKETFLNIFLTIDNLKKNETDSVEVIKTKILELISPLR